MDRVYRWISKHKISSVILYNVICWILPLLLLSLTIKIWPIIWISIGFVCFSFSLLVVTSVDENYFIKNAIQLLNEQCDPFPLFEAVEQKLPSVKPSSRQQRFLINKAVALRHFGRFDDAFSILSGINIDKYSATLPLIKIVYYNNLADILIIKGDYFQANIWYLKMLQMINDFKANEKQKKILNETSILVQAELLTAGGNFAQAENLIGGLPESTLSNMQRISKHMLYAKLLVKQNRPDEAKQCLQYVIAYGNKLYAVLQAREMLNSLDDIGE